MSFKVRAPVEKAGSHTGDDETVGCLSIGCHKSLRNKLGLWFHSSQIAQIVHLGKDRVKARNEKGGK
jgi:hypothetical protein